MTPAAAYRAAVDAGRIDPDPAQQPAVDALNALHHALTRGVTSESASVGNIGRLLGKLRRRPAAPVPGLYLWGGVGRGKTLLMDIFHGCLPGSGKRRVHFHRFMQELHTALREMSGRRDPLAHIGATLAADSPVLCLDEMQVEDITDAMLMAGLLDALFRHGITLVTTSNVPPEDLYRGGLQRQRFLPAIGLLQQHCRVLKLAGDTDHRLRRLDQNAVYLTPTGPAADKALEHRFVTLTAGAVALREPVVVNNRPIPTVAWHPGVVWLDFLELCSIPRSKNDYLELARTFHTVILANIRPLDDEQSDRVHRLVTLVDALYDRGCKLICSADASPDALYQGRDLAFAFARTRSRLIEMQTRAYLARTHLG